MTSEPTYAQLNQGLPLFKNLAKPLEYGAGFKLKNRFIMASMTRTRGLPQDHVNEHVVTYYKQRAEGGVGQIHTEGALVSPQGSEYPNVPSIYTEKHAEGWKKVVEVVHKNDVVIFCQLWHVGRVARPDMPDGKRWGKPVSAASAIAARGGNFRQLNNAGYVEAPAHPDPQELVEEFRRGAQFAKQAGFDGVELHAAAGYLPQQFLDKNSNVRDDKWGGDYKNRCRFSLECLKAMIEVSGADRVGLKLNPCGGMNDIGMDEADTKETYGYLIEETASLSPVQIAQAD